MKTLVPLTALLLSACFSKGSGSACGRHEVCVESAAAGATVEASFQLPDSSAVPGDFYLFAEGNAELREGLSGRKTVTLANGRRLGLALWGATITRETVDALVDLPLYEIELRDCSVASDSGFSRLPVVRASFEEMSLDPALAAGLDSLESLALAIVDTDFAALLAPHEMRLCSLSFQFVSFPPEFSLGRMERLAELDIADCYGVSDRTFSQLSLPSLRCLRLGLFSLIGLEEDVLEQELPFVPPITNHTIQSFYSCSNLEFLAIEDADCATAKVFSGDIFRQAPWRKIHTLILRNCDTFDDGDLSSLEQLASLRHVSLEQTPFGSGTIGALGELPLLQDLDLYWSGDRRKLTDDVAMSVIARHPTLETLTIRGRMGISGEFLQQIPSDSRLGSLTLEDVRLSPKASIQALNLPRLQKLALASDGVFPNDLLMSFIRACPNLESLSVFGEELTVQSLCSAVIELHTLVELSFGVADFSGGAKDVLLKEIASHERLERLSLPRCSGFTGDDLLKLVDLKTLRYLAFSWDDSVAEEAVYELVEKSSITEFLISVGGEEEPKVAELCSRWPDRTFRAIRHRK